MLIWSEPPADWFAVACGTPWSAPLASGTARCGQSWGLRHHTFLLLSAAGVGVGGAPGSAQGLRRLLGLACVGPSCMFAQCLGESLSPRCPVGLLLGLVRRGSEHVVTHDSRLQHCHLLPWGPYMRPAPLVWGSGSGSVFAGVLHAHPAWVAQSRPAAVRPGHLRQLRLTCCGQLCGRQPGQAGPAYHPEILLCVAGQVLNTEPL